MSFRDSERGTCGGLPDCVHTSKCPTQPCLPLAWDSMYERFSMSEPRKDRQLTTPPVCARKSTATCRVDKTPIHPENPANEWGQQVHEEAATALLFCNWKINIAGLSGASYTTSFYRKQVWARFMLLYRCQRQRDPITAKSYSIHAGGQEDLQEHPSLCIVIVITEKTQNYLECPSSGEMCSCLADHTKHLGAGDQWRSQTSSGAECSADVEGLHCLTHGGSTSLFYEWQTMRGGHRSVTAARNTSY